MLLRLLLKPLGVLKNEHSHTAAAVRGANQATSQLVNEQLSVMSCVFCTHESGKVSMDQINNHLIIR